MNNKDILSILNSHREITKVDLGTQKDCTLFYDNFVRSCYENSKIERAGLDFNLRSTFYKFREGGDGLEFVNPKGRFLKRFSSFYKKTNGTLLSDTIMGVIGDILQSYVTGDVKEFWIDFTDKIDWKDGQFGKSGSCWWGMYAGSIPTYINNGGWTVRFYNQDKKGIGRTFVIPHNNILLGFNSYGVERASVSKVLKKVFADKGFELHYKTCEIKNGRHNEIPYINGGTGFQLYNGDGSDLYEEYDLDMEPEDCYRCVECGELGNDENFYNENDNWYCSDCYHKRFGSCDKCGNTFENDELVSISHKRYSSVCSNCAENLGFSQCSSCEEYHENCIISNNDSTFCENCNECFYCESCDIYIEDADECKICVEQEEAENNDDIELVKEPIKKWDGGYISPIGNVYGNVNFQGLLAFKSSDYDFGIFHKGTGQFIQSGISSLRTALTALEMYGKLANWEEIESEKQASENQELMEKAQIVTRYIKGLENGN